VAPHLFPGGTSPTIVARWKPAESTRGHKQTENFGHAKTLKRELRPGAHSMPFLPIFHESSGPLPRPEDTPALAAVAAAVAEPFHATAPNAAAPVAFLPHVWKPPRWRDTVL
jgi:hypothetical protein